MGKSNKVNIAAGLFEAFNYEQISVTNSVKTLTDTKYLGSDGEYAKRVIITVEDAPVRYNYDGSTPTSDLGHRLNPTDVLVIIGTRNIQNFKCIRQGSSNGEINASYEK